MAESNSFTFKIDNAQAEQLRAILTERGFTFREVPYALFGAQKDKTTVNAYTSGKLLVQGRGAKEFIEFILEPEILGEARLGYEEIHNPEMYQPHIGIDESGKGDFFGPLVIAAAYVDGPLARDLIEMGVKDSKQISSDKKALDLSDKIKECLGKRWSVVAIGPERYNELYSKFKNLNRLLAWGHATVLENVLEIVPACPRALSDQFANPKLVEQALHERGRGIILQQRTKAESDIAVAAASILARAEFLRRLDDLGKKAGFTLPKGASAAVLEQGKKIVAAQGEAGLRSVSKYHFRTYLLAMGQEPPPRPDPSVFRRPH